MYRPYFSTFYKEFFPMAPKKQKKSPQKIPNLPKNANVKIIEISLRNILMPVFFILLLVSLYYTWQSFTSTEKITYNDTVGLNTIAARYASGEYEEIIVQGSSIEAKKYGITNVVDSKAVVQREVDRSILPVNLKITDIGLSDPKNRTKVTIRDEGW